MSELNKMVFWNEVIEALELKIKNFVQSNSKVFTEEYFKNFENNQHHTFGRMCLALKDAKTERQKVNDKFAQSLNSEQEDKE